MKRSAPNTIRKAPDKISGNTGFTLIEVALALIIVGLIMTPLLWLYNLEHKRNMVNDNKAALSKLNVALSNYAQQNDHYPRPASLTLEEGDQGHGFSEPGTDTCNNLATTGYCEFTNPGNGNTILIGAVPFATLDMESNRVLDSWKNQILYVVTRDQTDPSTYNPNGLHHITTRTIDPVSGNSVVTTVTDPHGNSVPVGAEVLLISYGPTGKGAFTAAGRLTAEPCVGAVAEREDINCNFTIAVDEFLLDGAGEIRSLAEGTPEYYDDFTNAILSQEKRSWNENVNAFEKVVTDKERIGIGTTDPTATIEVAGPVLIEGGLLTPQACKDGRCFNPESIYGDVPEMQCNQNSLPGPEPVTGIGSPVGDTRVICASPSNNSGEPVLSDQRKDIGGGNDAPIPPFVITNSPITALDCGATQRVTAISPAGVITCR